MKFISTLSALLLTTFALTAQVVYTEPAFPTATDAVTIFFDASEGTGGLENCNCDVYIHTGVITSQSTSGSDWKNVQTEWGVADPDWQLTPVPGEANLYSYEITPSINAYYGIGDNVTVEQIAMVFRNADGSAEGKDTGGADIYVDVVASTTELQTVITSPNAQNLVVAPGEEIEVIANSSLEGTLSLFDNGTLLTSTVGSSLTYTLTAPNDASTHLIEFTAEVDGETSTKSFQYVVATDVTGSAPAGTEPGITYLSDSAVRFALFAPQKTTAFLLGDFTDWNLSTDFQMQRDGELFWIEVDGLTPGEYAGFQYLVDGDILITDPYAELILDQQNDPFISEETFPNLPDYPEATTGRVGLIRPGFEEFDWQHDDFEPAKRTDLVIYELLMRDFLDAHNYQTLLDTLDYLERLGVNAVEFMPVNEFSGNISWGYNPTYHAALDKYYGDPESFKTVIDELHNRGIAVILDVVFNHAHEDNPYAKLYWDAANFRPAPNSPFMNPTAPHNFSVFFDYNHEAAVTRDYFKRVLRYWIDEYHVDGFRFDLSKGLTQNDNGGNFDAFAYDADRIAILKEYTDQIFALDPDSYVIMEHFAANDEEQELTDYGMMVWGGFGPHDEYLEASMGYPANFTSSDYRARGFSEPHLIVYAESHDEERMMYKNLQFGNSSGDYNVKDKETALDRVALTHNLFLTIPGPKMLWQFQELGYDLSINYCPNGTVDESCRTAPKPILWGFLNEPERAQLYLRTAALVQLRTEFEVFETTDFELEQDSHRKVLRLMDQSAQDMDVVVMGNFDVTPRNLTPGFPSTGTWYEFWTGEELDVNNPDMTMNFEAGEYRLYTTQPLQQPVATREVLDTDLALTVHPNPNGGRFAVSYELAAAAPVTLELFDALGRSVAPALRQTAALGVVEMAPHTPLAPGVYLLKMTTEGRSTTQRIVVQ